MDKEYELKYLRLEKDGWWFRARRDIIVRFLTRQKLNSKILDVGCSGGVLLAALQEKGYTNLWGIDISQRSVEQAKSLGFKNVVVMDAVATGFPDNSFDSIIASDTLEHIFQADKALLEWYRILRPGGQLYVFVPAHQFLWSEHDVANHHIKRYSKKGLREDIRRAGFQITKLGYWDVLLFFPAFFVRFLPTRKSRSDQLDTHSPFMNAVLYRILKVENICIQFGFSFPVGVSLFCCARKKEYRVSHIGERKSLMYETEIYRLGSYDDYMWQLEKKIITRELELLKRETRRIEHLDFACGSGRVLAYLEHDVERAVGVDISASMLDIAKGKTQKATLFEADITKDDILRGQSFDLITAFRFYLNAESPLRDAAFAILQKKLRANRSLLIFNVHGNATSVRVFTKWWFWWTGRQLNTATYREVREFLRRHGFVLIRWYGIGVLPKICYRIMSPRVALFLDRLLTAVPLARYVAQDLIFVCEREM